MSENGVIVMEENDRQWIKELFSANFKPVTKELAELKVEVRERFDKLPCKSNTKKLIQIETREINGKEFAKTKYDYRDWLLKAALGLLTLIGVLYTIGFFRALAKGQ